MPLLQARDREKRLNKISKAKRNTCDVESHSHSGPNARDLITHCASSLALEIPASVSIVLKLVGGVV